MVRARRTGQPLVLGFIDIDQLKAVNDSNGHAAGDRTLLRVATTLRERLRLYDLLIRYGGDEFVCVISDLNSDTAALRLARANDELAAGPAPTSFTFGLAEMRPTETAEELVARADAALYRERRHTPSRAG
ncbi:MAG: hypothetical protein QOI80_893 [Solirubrobacteraceae bacterium]|nr:hypothetical protein [Solirubrobacteraceae bacterium]